MKWLDEIEEQLQNDYSSDGLVRLLDTDMPKLITTLKGAICLLEGIDEIHGYDAIRQFLAKLEEME